MDAAAPWLCLVCGLEVGSKLQQEDLDACPACGDGGPPLADRLEAQHPGRSPLTVTGEMAAMVAQLGRAPAPDDSGAP